MFEKKISFVIPCYYSEKSLAGVVENIQSEFPSNEYNSEIVLVNDGSTDCTYGVIKALAKKYPNVIGVNLAKNFGQDAAKMAGYNQATGDYIITLDDDGQNPPCEAHKLIAKMEEGYDAVFGKYHEKKDTQFKKFGHELNDKMAVVMLGKPKTLTLNGYFIMNSFVKNEIIKYKGAFPYVWGLILRTTSNLADEYIDHKEREIGTSTYTIAKLLGLWMNGFTSFSIKPLRVSVFTGTIVAGVGFLSAVIFILQKLVWGISVRGWTSLVVIILILSGVQLIMLGLVGEYIGRIFMNNNNAPQYVVRSIEKFEEMDFE